MHGASWNSSKDADKVTDTALYSKLMAGVDEVEERDAKEAEPEKTDGKDDRTRAAAAHLSLAL